MFNGAVQSIYKRHDGKLSSNPLTMLKKRLYELYIIQRAFSSLNSAKGNSTQ